MPFYSILERHVCIFERENTLYFVMMLMHFIQYVSTNKVCDNTRDKTRADDIADGYSHRARLCDFLKLIWRFEMSVYYYYIIINNNHHLYSSCIGRNDKKGKRKN